MSDTRTVYISIGNSDDKLTQAAWAQFYRVVNLNLRDHATAVHGQWVSEPASSWQNACWCIELTERSVPVLKETLAKIAGEYAQDSIAWAEATTEFIGAEVPA